LSPGPRDGRRRVLLSLRFVVSVALLSFLFTRVDARAVWASAHRASPAWLLAALSLYFANVLASVWRWHVLLEAQQVHIPRRTLLSSYLVAGFFNNFLPSNIGGDVVRIRDTARPAQSKTLAATIVLVDRGLGLMGLVLVAAVGATAVGLVQGHAPPIWPTWLWAGFLLGATIAGPAVLAPTGVGRLLQPLTRVHPAWVGDRIDKLTGALARFRARPTALLACFAGAVGVQAILVGFYAAVVRSLDIHVTGWDLAVLVPVSFVLQMLPLSVNGFGVREATFAFYFNQLGLPVQSAIVVSLMGTALMMLFSLTGAAVYVCRSAATAQPASDGASRG
jgi:uncharacterized membrane protein YbhN (UPF0104 family)